MKAPAIRLLEIVAVVGIGMLAMRFAGPKPGAGTLNWNVQKHDMEKDA
jgi:hypothetical protein